MAAGDVVELENFAVMTAAPARHNQAYKAATQYADSHYPVSYTLTATHSGWPR
jgi:hypothetical protein